MSKLPPLPIKFKKALKRIKDGKTNVINLNRAITPTAVAREAAFDPSYIHQSVNAELKKRIIKEIEGLVINGTTYDDIDKEIDKLFPQKPRETRAQTLERQTENAKVDKFNAEAERDSALRRMVIIEERLLSLEAEQKRLEDSIERNSNISLIDRHR